MAYVRKTDTLVQEINRAVHDMKDAALTKFLSSAIEYGTPTFDAAVESVTNAVFRDAPELKGKLPESWYKSHEAVTVHFKKDDGDLMFTTRLETPRSAGIKLPKVVDSRYYSVEVEVSYSECTNELKTWLDDENNRNIKRGEIAEQYRAVSEQLTAFMGQHASLNAAIKEMPEIEMYVPEIYIRKLREPSAKRAKKTEQPSVVEELGIDRDALATMAIAHRITQ